MNQKILAGATLNALGRTGWRGRGFEKRADQKKKSLRRKKNIGAE